MNFNSTEMRGTDEFVFEATYGTTVFLTRGEKANALFVADRKTTEVARMFERRELARQPKAA